MQLSTTALPWMLLLWGLWGSFPVYVYDCGHCLRWCGVVLNKIILRGLSNIFVLPVYINDWGRILEISLNIMQLSNNNTKRTMTLMLKLIITRPILDFWAQIPTSGSWKKYRYRCISQYTWTQIPFVTQTVNFTGNWIIIIYSKHFSLHHALWKKVFISMQIEQHS